MTPSQEYERPLSEVSDSFTHHSVIKGGIK